MCAGYHCRNLLDVYGGYIKKENENIMASYNELQFDMEILLGNIDEGLTSNVGKCQLLRFNYKTLRIRDLSRGVGEWVVKCHMRRDLISVVGRVIFSIFSSLPVSDLYSSINTR